jgi:RNA polymerase-associated protein CTR9
LIYDLAYLKAETVFEREEVSIPAELYNNIGVLYQTLGDIQKAKEYFSRALSMLSKMAEDPKSDVNSQNMTTTLYNTGRLCEAEQDFERAKSFYTKVLAIHPAYSDGIACLDLSLASLRLGALLMQSRNFDAAEQIIMQVIETDARNIDAGLMLGQCFLDADKRKEAKRAFEGVLQNIDSHDAYALCQCAGWYVKSAQEDPKNKAKLFQRAFEFYDKTLKDDGSRNYCAANGIAICLAENGEKERAKELFSQV